MFFNEICKINIVDIKDLKNLEFQTSSEQVNKSYLDNDSDEEFFNKTDEEFINDICGNDNKLKSINRMLQKNQNKLTPNKYKTCSYNQCKHLLLKIELCLGCENYFCVGCLCFCNNCKTYICFKCNEIKDDVKNTSIRNFFIAKNPDNDIKMSSGIKLKISKCLCSK